MKIVLALVAVSLLSGCSWLFHDRTNDYLQAKEQPVIEVPKEVALVALKPQMVIPSVKNQEALPEAFELPRPGKLEIVEEDESASLVEVSNQPLVSELEKDGNGTPILRLNVKFPRAWAAIGESIKQTDIDVSDLNRSIGTYYIQVEDKEAVVEQGFWASLFGSEPEKVMVDYLIKVNRARSGVYVSIQKDAETLADESIANLLLGQIQENLK